MLAAALKPFVIRAVKAAVGEDFASSYYPRAWDTPSLLAFIRSKWIGTFADTGLGASGVGGRELVARLTKHVHVLQQSGAGAAAMAAAAGLLADGERLAEAVGDRGRGGRVAALRAAVDAEEKQGRKRRDGASPRAADATAAKGAGVRKGSPPRRSRLSSIVVSGGGGVPVGVRGASDGREIARGEAPARAPLSGEADDSAVAMEMEAPASARAVDAPGAPSFSPPAPVGLAANGQGAPLDCVDGLAAQPPRGLPAAANGAGTAVRGSLHVVLDGPNVAWAHGANRRFSPAGILLAEAFFRSAGHAVTTFLPISRLPLAGAGGSAGEETAVAAAAAATSPAGLPPPGRDRDIVAMAGLRARAGTSALALVPDGEYDDTYGLAWARRTGGVVVSNDTYGDMIYQASAGGVVERDEWAAWLRACRLPFTWVGDDFVPSPLFDWDRAARAGGRGK
ncbi:hypothetical protein MMPV_002432 [Pyropia vietnamensis]